MAAHITAVSYTHLDVYKRQEEWRTYFAPAYLYVLLSFIRTLAFMMKLGCLEAQGYETSFILIHFILNKRNRNPSHCLVVFVIYIQSIVFSVCQFDSSIDIN